MKPFLSISRITAMICLFLIIGFLSSSFILPPIDEICNNAIDDDNDGLIDLNDPDCECTIVEPISLIPNPSFEEQECCPSEDSQLHCATGWIQASYPTTDYIHACDWLGWDGALGWDDFPPPMPFPDGDGIVGFRNGRVDPNNSAAHPNWKEYAGACLLSSLEVGITYRMEFDIGFVDGIKSPPINISFFGSTDCTNLPFGVNSPVLIGCPSNEPGWMRLGSILVSGKGKNKWVKTFIEVTPTEEITTIAIGPDCSQAIPDVSTFYFFDNLLLSDSESFDLRITEVSHPCNGGFSLEIPSSSGFSYQWFKDGIALIGESSPQLSTMYGEGNYQIKVENGSSCKLSAPYLHEVPSFTSSFSKFICKEEEYSFGGQMLSEPGDYTDTLKSIHNCDSIVTLNLKLQGVIPDTVSVKIFEGENYEIGTRNIRKEGNHLLTLTSSNNCDSLILLELAYYKVVVPTAFSPNDDGVNDYFRIVGGSDLIESELTIFDRWGNQVYQGEEWDGKYKLRDSNISTFVYLARIKMEGGMERKFSGRVLVIK